MLFEAEFWVAVGFVLFLALAWKLGAFDAMTKGLDGRGKRVRHELDEARRRIAADDLAPALKMMARVSRIQAQLIQSWEVLATMTPADYARMRGGRPRTLSTRTREL